MAGQPTLAVHISLTLRPKSVYSNLAEELLIILISVLRTISNSDAAQDGRAAAWLAAGGAGRGRWSAGASTYVAVTNPSMVAAPTAYQGYCCVHQLTFAASLAVACISATVR